MFPWLRLIRVAFTLIGRAQVDLFATTRVRLRVWPNDLDINAHVNNARYLALADIGRMHWFARTGLLQLARARKAYPVIGDAIAKFRRDLKLFQVFEIHTRMLGWDEKWGFIEHRFVREGRVLGVVTIRGVFKGPQGPVEPAALLAALSRTDTPPELPAWTLQFHEGSESLSQVLRSEERAQGLR